MILSVRRHAHHAAQCAGREIDLRDSRRAVLVRGLLVIIAVLLTLVPIIHWAIAVSLEEGWRRSEPPAPFTLAASPVAAILAAYTLDNDRNDLPPFIRIAGARIPLHFAFVLIMAALGVAFRAFAWKRLRRIRKEAE